MESPWTITMRMRERETPLETHPLSWEIWISSPLTLARNVMPRKNACSSIPSWSWSLTVSYGVDGILMYRLSMESVVNFKYHEKNRILFLSCCASAVSKILKVALASAPPRFMTTGALLKAPLLLVLVLVITLHYSTTLHDDLIN